MKRLNWERQIIVRCNYRKQNNGKTEVQKNRKIDYLKMELQKNGIRERQNNGIRERQNNEIRKIELWNNGKQEFRKNRITDRQNCSKTGLQIDKISVLQINR